MKPSLRLLVSSSATTLSTTAPATSAALATVSATATETASATSPSAVATFTLVAAGSVALNLVETVVAVGIVVVRRGRGLLLEPVS